MNHDQPREEMHAIWYGVVLTIIYSVEGREKQLRLLEKNLHLAHRLNGQDGYPPQDIEQIFFQARSFVESGIVGWQ